MRPLAVPASLVGEGGAIASINFNYDDGVGHETGKIMLRVFKGEHPGDLAVQGVEITQPFVNPGVAEDMGLTTPARALVKETE